MPSRRRLLLAALTTGAVPPARALGEYRLGHVGGPGSLFELSANEFARRANEKLAGKGKVVVYGSSQLGGDREMLQKLRAGTLDFALPSTVMSSEVDAFGMFEMPYLVKNREHMRKIEAEVVWPALAPMAEAKGYALLAVWENGFRHITTNARPIVKPADLRGIKLRVPEGKWRVRMFRAYGASPWPMALSEVFAALQARLIDGQENPLTQIWSAKFQEVQKYLSLTGHVYTPAYLTAGAARYAGLPRNVQAAFADAAKDTQAYVYEQAAKLDSDLLAKIRTSGIKVNDVDKDAFIIASRGVYDEFGREVPPGGLLVEKAVALGRNF